MVNLNAKPKVLFTEEQIQARIQELAHDISKDYAHKHPLILVTLAGSIFFATDLMRKMEYPIEVDFIKASSYGSGDVSSGVVSIQYMPTIPLAGRHVIVVEDIIDTGATLQKLRTVLTSDENNKPASFAIVCLLDKPSRRKVDLVPEYVGFSIPDTFVVGYGLDYNNRYRNMPDVRYFE